MPYQKIEDNRLYQKGYWAGFIYAIKLILGSVCSNCGKSGKLEIHHKYDLKRKFRRWKDYVKISEIELLCSECHKVRFKK